MSGKNHAEKVCNGDCFNCPYPDCILEFIPLSEAAAESRKIDEIIHTAEHGKNAERQREYAQIHAASRKERHHQWYLKNREYALAYQRDYDRTHRERSREQHKENYRKKQES